MPVPGIHNSLVLERTGFPIKPGMTRRQEFDFLECIKINDGSVSHNIYIFELFYQLSKAMAKQTTTIPIASIILDEEIYPRDRIDQKRVGIFAENIRDGFKFDPIEVEPAPDKPGRYRLLDGAHRWSAYKSTGITETEAVIKNLDGTDPLLYAAKKAIGPRQLTEDEARETARRAYNKNPA